MEIELLVNTADDILFENIAANCARPLRWVESLPGHDGHAVIVGGGPSVADWIEEIRMRQSEGQDVFALNNAFAFLLDHGIHAEYQVILDAREHNEPFIGKPPLHGFLLASQCHPKLFDKAGEKVMLWHPAFPEQMREYERCVPEERRGLVDMAGGGSTIGLSAMSIAYMMGYRKLHLYGYDSSYRDKNLHAYQQTDPQRADCSMTVRGKTFRTTLAMAGQAERFPRFCDNLIDLGCVITLRGDGLLPHIMSESSRPPLTEQQKYELMWTRDEYRRYSPGEQVAVKFLEIAKPSGTVLDLGAGTGRAGLEIAKHCDVILIDFADNCLDEKAKKLPNLCADLASCIPVRGDYGFCADVMEHIPPGQVDKVLTNIFGACPDVFFQISTVPDALGKLIGEPLHLSVHPFEWWKEKLAQYGKVIWSEAQKDAAIFYIKRK